jgi:hypothetical protein
MPTRLVPIPFTPVEARRRIAHGYLGPVADFLEGVLPGDVDHFNAILFQEKENPEVSACFQAVHVISVRQP